MTGAPRNSRALAVLLALGCVWGASFLFIKVIVDEISPMELVAGRLFFGSVSIALFMLARRVRPPLSPLLIAQMSVMALVSNIMPFALIAWGEEHIDSGIASVLNSTMPIFTSVLAAAFLEEEKFTTGRLAGLLLGFVGVITLTGEGILNITDSSVIGQLAVIGAAACYGIGSIVSRKLLRAQDPMVLSSMQVTLGTIWCVPLVFVLEGTPDYSLSVEAWLSLLALGVFGTGFGYIAYLWLIATTGSVRASLVTYVVPVVGLFLGWAVLDEGIGLNTLAGAALIVVGVAAVMRGQAPGRALAGDRVAVEKLAK